MSIFNDLKKQILLEQLNDSELRKVARLVEVRNYSKGDPMFRENELSIGIYMIKSGTVEITKKLPIDLKTKVMITMRNLQNCCEIRKAPDGWRQVFATLIDGYFFGELSIVEGRKKHGADADATEHTEILFIRTNKFNKLVDTDPVIMLKIMKLIAKFESRKIRIIDKQILKILIGI